MRRAASSISHSFHGLSTRLLRSLSSLNGALTAMRQPVGALGA